MLSCHCEPSVVRSGFPCGGLCEAARTAKAVFATSRSRCLTGSRLVGNCLSGSAKWRTVSTWAWSSISVGRRLLKGLSFIATSFGFQQLKQFVARNEQFTAQCPTHFEFTPLDEAVNAEIIDAQEISGLLDGIWTNSKTTVTNWPPSIVSASSLYWQKTSATDSTTVN